MIIRPYYLDMLKTYRDVPLVKILAGIRRCGKSTILDMLKDDLICSGIAADHVIHLRYTSEELDDSMTAKQMYRDIKEKMTDSERYYLLLDEVQEVDGLTVFVIEQRDFCSIAYQDNLTQYMMYLNTDFASAIEIAKTISDTES